MDFNLFFSREQKRGTLEKEKGWSLQVATE
jgi:hypothetical protein